MIEVRCPYCGRKLLECSQGAKISIKCPKCKNIVDINAKQNLSNNRLPINK